MLRRRRWVEAVHFEVDCLSLEIKCDPPPPHLVLTHVYHS